MLPYSAAGLLPRPCDGGVTPGQPVGQALAKAEPAGRTGDALTP